MLNCDSRLMLIAPHPDDEALACSIMLQRAVDAGASVRVVYATDGDDNPWPQRLLERKWFITSADRARWGKLRQSEALAALQVLGVKADQAVFLGLPDQGLTNLLRTDCRATVEQLAAIIRDWSPTHLLVPSVADTHPDHSALAVLLRLVLTENSELQTTTFSYAVHGTSAAFLERAERFAPTNAETETKVRAILCHKTQIKLSRKRFLSYARRPERFVKFHEGERPRADGAIREVVRHSNVLSLTLRLSPKLVRTTETTLFLLGHDSTGAPRCIKTRLPRRSCEAEMVNCSADLRTTGRYRGNLFGGEFEIPVGLFSSPRPLFVKLERRSLFFDEAGWLEIPPLVRAEESESHLDAEPALTIR